MFFILSIAPLFAIVYQDFKDREFSWYWLVILFVLSIWGGWAFFEMKLWTNILLNLAFLLFLYGSLILYISLKEKKLTNIFDVHIGWGDPLFMLAVLPVFSPLNFIFFVVLSSFFALLVGLTIRWVKKENSIPLAGVCSLLMLLCFFTGYIYGDERLMNFQFKTLLFD